MPRISMSRKGQLVIPISIRREVGLQLGGRVEVQLDQGRIVLVPASDAKWDWLNLRGVLKGTTALQDHLREHRAELERDEQGS